MLPLAAAAALALATYPRDASKAPAEDASMDPIAVCKALVAASKAQDIDTFIGFTSSYARKNFDAASRLAVRESRIILKEVICVRLTSEDDKANPPSALVWIYAPNHKSRNMPFIRESGFWRLDWDTYWHSSGGNPTK
jgi:hypothetical protein